MTNETHLAVSTSETEGFSVICAYTEKADAETFINECKEYEATKEVYPDDDTGKDFDLWLNRKIEWMENHPAGVHGDCFGYDVFTVELK